MTGSANRRPTPRIPGGAVHALITRVDRGETTPAEAIEHLRGRLGGWKPGRDEPRGPLSSARPPDFAAVEQLIHMQIHHSNAHPADIKEAVRRLTAACCSIPKIAEQLDLSERSVVRYRRLINLEQE